MRYLLATLSLVLSCGASRAAEEVCVIRAASHSEALSGHPGQLTSDVILSSRCSPYPLLLNHKSMASACRRLPSSTETKQVTAHVLSPPPAPRSSRSCAEAPGCPLTGQGGAATSAENIASRAMPPAEWRCWRQWVLTVGHNMGKNR
jgi:hypothetical protein